MQAPSRLRVGLHIEHARTLALVQTMLAQAGHDYVLDSPGVHSLATYLGIVLDQVRQAPSSPYDLLIVGGVEADALTDPAVLLLPLPRPATSEKRPTARTALCSLFP
jgi:hypothetical protein